MGVLNFHNRLHQSTVTHPVDVITFEAHQDEDIHLETQSDPTPQSPPRYKRKRVKSGSRPVYSLDIEEGTDRKRGSKHQRRKQNFNELKELAGLAGVVEDIPSVENQMTAFAELFLDDKKMKLWECFTSLSEEKQDKYIHKIVSNRASIQSGNYSDHATSSTDDLKYYGIDKKIRDILKNKQLAHDVNGLLKYYEEDLNYCLESISGSAMVIMVINDAYDRMLLYALCQYMNLLTSTIKLDSGTIIEIDLDDQGYPSPNMLLSEYLKVNKGKLC